MNRDTQTALDLSARDAVLDQHRRKELVRWLEWECFRATGWLEDGTRTPVSANTCRAILEAWEFRFDPRLFGGVFPVSRWQQVGEARSDSGKCHARRIRTFLPWASAVPLFVEVPRPIWLVRVTP